MKNPEVLIDEANGQSVEFRQRMDRTEGCHTANGILTCYCGKCEPDDYKLPSDFYPAQKKN